MELSIVSEIIAMGSAMKSNARKGLVFFHGAGIHAAIFFCSRDYNPFAD